MTLWYIYLSTHWSNSLMASFISTYTCRHNHLISWCQTIKEWPISCIDSKTICNYAIVTLIIIPLTSATNCETLSIFINFIYYSAMCKYRCESERNQLHLRDSIAVYHFWNSEVAQIWNISRAKDLYWRLYATFHPHTWRYSHNTVTPTYLIHICMFLVVYSTSWLE